MKMNAGKGFDYFEAFQILLFDFLTFVIEVFVVATPRWSAGFLILALKQINVGYILSH